MFYICTKAVFFDIFQQNMVALMYATIFLFSHSNDYFSRGVDW